MVRSGGKAAVATSFGVYRGHSGEIFMGFAGRVASRLLVWLIQRVVDAAAMAALIVVNRAVDPASGTLPPWLVAVAWIISSGYLFTTLLVVLIGVPRQRIPYAIMHAVLFFVHVFIVFGISTLMGSPQWGLPLVVIVVGPVAVLASALAVRFLLERLFA
jgi:predicted ferric reductase